MNISSFTEIPQYVRFQYQGKMFRNFTLIDSTGWRGTYVNSVLYKEKITIMCI